MTDPTAAKTNPGHFFEDFRLGQQLRHATPRTVTTGDTLLIGRAAQVLHWDDNEGEVQVSGERWRATSAAALAPGQRVRVVGRHDLTLAVEPEAKVSSKL